MDMIYMSVMLWMIFSLCRKKIIDEFPASAKSYVGFSFIFLLWLSKILYALHYNNNLSRTVKCKTVMPSSSTSATFRDQRIVCIQKIMSCMFVAFWKWVNITSNGFFRFPVPRITLTWLGEGCHHCLSICSAGLFCPHNRAHRVCVFQARRFSTKLTPLISEPAKYVWRSLCSSCPPIYIQPACPWPWMVW